MGRQTLAKSGEWSLDASSKQCDQVQIAVAAAVRRVSVIVNNRCLESDGITARDRPHGKGPKAHPPPAAGSRGGLSIRQPGAKIWRSTLCQASYSLILSQCFVHTCLTLILSRPFLASLLLTPSLSLYPLRVCWCWVACYAPLAACTQPVAFDFSHPDRSSTPSRIRHKPATSHSNAQEEGRQGAGSREAKGQGTERTSCSWQACVDEEVCQKLR